MLSPSAAWRNAASRISDRIVEVHACMMNQCSLAIALASGGEASWLASSVRAAT